MPGRATRIEETQIIKDILRQLRRHRAVAVSQEPIWTYNTFTAPATYQLTYIPYGINALADNNSMLSEGTDYTVDYATGLITFAVGRTAGHVIFVSYVTNGDLIAASGTADTGHLASDTFTRANSSTLGSTEGGSYAWTPGSGTNWSISSNTLVGTMAVNDANAVLTINPGVADITMKADFTTRGSALVSGLAFRATDLNNHLRIATDGRLWKRVAGVDTALMTSGAIAAGSTVQVVASGSSISYYVNGVQRGTTVVETFNQTVTKHGFFATDETVAFDNFTLDSP